MQFKVYYHKQVCILNYIRKLIFFHQSKPVENIIQNMKIFTKPNLVLVFNRVWKSISVNGIDFIKSITNHRIKVFRGLLTSCLSNNLYRRIPTYQILRNPNSIFLSLMLCIFYKYPAGHYYDSNYAVSNMLYIQLLACTPARVHYTENTYTFWCWFHCHMLVNKVTKLSKRQCSFWRRVRMFRKQALPSEAVSSLFFSLIFLTRFHEFHSQHLADKLRLHYN